jgi:hypothetical protein
MSQEDRAKRAYQSAKKAWEAQLIKAKTHIDEVKELWESNINNRRKDP